MKSACEDCGADELETTLEEHDGGTFCETCVPCDCVEATGELCARCYGRQLDRKGDEDYDAANDGSEIRDASDDGGADF